MDLETISAQLFYTIVRIETTKAGVITGTGTGFLFSYNVSSGQHITFIVSNKHVVMGEDGGSVTVHKRNGSELITGEGVRVSINNWKPSWFGHPSPLVDIAVCPFGPIEATMKLQQDIDLFYRTLTVENIPSADQAAQIDALEEVTFIGYPNGLWDEANFLPIARRGMTATPISVEFNNKPIFLIDASVFGGSSGSPVFIYKSGTFGSHDAGLTVPPTLYFIGVVAAVYFRTEVNEIVQRPIPTSSSIVKHSEMIDLGVVFKARTVVETIEAFLKFHGVTI